MSALVRRFRVVLCAGAAALALGGSASAQAARTDFGHGRFAVAEANARVHAFDRPLDYRVEQDELIFRTRSGQYYRANLTPDCARALSYGYQIGLDTGGSGDLDQFSILVIDGRRCAVQSLDRLAPA